MVVKMGGHDIFVLMHEMYKLFVDPHFSHMSPLDSEACFLVKKIIFVKIGVTTLWTMHFSQCVPTRWQDFLFIIFEKDLKLPFIFILFFKWKIK